MRWNELSIVFSIVQYRILMTADGLVKDFKRLLAMKCGLPAAKVTLVLLCVTFNDLREI